MSPSKYYNKMVVRESPYMSTWMTDTNHLRQLLSDVEPQQMDSLVNQLFMHRRDFSNPLLSDLEKSSKTTMLLTGPTDTWTWKFHKPLESPEVLTKTYTDPTDLANLGKGRLPFDILLDRNWYTYGDVISPDRFSGYQVRVVPDGIRPELGGYRYTVQMVSDTDDMVYPEKYLEVGTQYEYLYSIYGEYNDQGTKVIHGGEIQLMNGLAGEHRTEDSITDWADALTITMASVTIDDRGQPVKLKDPRWFKRSEYACWAKHRMQKENYLMWAAPSFNLMSPSAYDVSTCMGFWHMLHLGNVHYYSTLTMKKLETAVNEMYYNRVPAEQRNLVLYTGEAGFLLFSEAVEKKMNGLGGLIPLDKFITGSGMDMGFGFQFRSYRMINGGVITLKHLKTLDHATTKHERGAGRFSKMSATFLAVDISNDAVENIRIVKRNTRQDDYWGYIPGTASPYGPIKGGISSNKKAGYEMWIYSRQGLDIQDITKTFIMKPTFEY